MKRFYDPNAQNDVKEFKDIEYVRHGDHSMLLDLYLPSHGEGRFPLIVYVPGGAWMDCDKSVCVPMKLGFCQKGYAAASITYRTSKTPFPAQIEDGKAAIRWIRANAEKYNIDPTRIGVMGTSAGGHMACLLGVTGKARQFDVGENLDQSSEVQAVCNCYGATDFVNFFDDFKGDPGKTEFLHRIINALLGGSLDEKAELAKQGSPITHVDENAPPFLTIHGIADPTVPFQQAEILHDKLRQNGVSSQLILIPDGGHGDPKLFSQPLIDEIFRFFDEKLLRQNTPSPRRTP